MKKSFIKVLVFLLVLTLSSCDFNSLAIPTTLYVKTKADFSFSLANFDLNLSDYFSKATIQNAVGNSDSIKVYDYFPNSADTKVQQFLIRMPLQEIPVNFEDYLNQFNVDTLLQKTSFSKSITIPSINLQASETFDLQSALNLLVSYSGSSASITFQTGFTTLTYSSGTMTIACPTATGTVTLKDSGGLAVASGTFSSGTASLSLSNDTISKTGMTLEFSSAYTGSIGIVTTGTISEAKELALSMSAISKTISNPLSSAITACTIGTGNLVISTENLPSGISLTTLTSSIGGLTISSTTSQTISLNSNSLSSSDIVISCTPSLSGDATFSTPATSVTFKFATNISSLSSLSIEDDSFENLSVDINQSFPSEMLEMIDSITFTDSGIGGNYKNTFPASNDISIVMNAPILGISSQTETLSSNTGSTNPSFEIKSSGDTTVNVGNTSPAINSLVVNLQIQVPGYDSTNKKKMTVTDVVPGSTYNIAVSVTPVINWKSISINNVTSNQSGKLPLKFSLFDIMESFKAKIGENIAPKIEVDSLPVYLYFSRPNISAFDDISVSGKLASYVGDENGNILTGESKSYILGNSSTPATMAFASEPTLSTDSSDVVTTDISNITSSCSTNLKTTLNKTRDATNKYICIDYDVAIANSSLITVTKDQITDANSSIAIVAYICVPLKFNVTDSNGITINVLDMLGMSGSTDLFKRTTATDVTSFQQYLDALTSVDLVYQTPVLPFNSTEEIKVIVEHIYGSSDTEKLTLGMSGGSISLNPSKICSIYPLLPDINLVIPQTSFSITRNTAVNLNVGVTLHTDGIVNIFGN
jgi:hypothetical protein